MEQITSAILSNKPDLTDNSVKSYLSNIRRIYKNTAQAGIDKINVNYFIDNKPNILKYLNELKLGTRKTLLASLVVLTDDEDYRTAMLTDIEKYTKEMNKNEKDQKQIKNWVSSSDIEKIYKQLKKEANALYKKTNKTNDDLLKIQNYIIISLLGGIYIAPRRLLDYTEFKIKNVDKEKDNYLDIKQKQLVFNNYKTSKTYKEQRVDVPKPLLTILKKWIKINPTDYLLFDSLQSKLINVQLTQYLNKIFGKKVSVNLLRHVYITEHMPSDLDTLDTMKARADNMGHGITMHLAYVKK